MTRKLTVKRAPGQCAPIPAKTPIFGKRDMHCGIRDHYGYYGACPGDDYFLLGYTIMPVPSGASTFTVQASGDLEFPLDGRLGLKMHGGVRLHRTKKGVRLAPAEPFGPASLVAPGSTAAQGLAKLAGAVIDAALATTTLDAAQKRAARAAGVEFARTALKASARVGRRSAAVQTGVREAQNGAALLIDAIRRARTDTIGRVVAIGDRTATIRLHV